MRTISEYLTARGAWILKVHGGLGQRPGVGDLLACLPPSGRLVSVEVKTGNAVMSTTQKIEQAKIEKAGGLFILARSADDVEQALIAAGAVKGVWLT